jgi:hypothetical protein
MVAEDGAAFVLAPAFDQLIPIVVPDFVTKMADQGTLCFAHRHTQPFALDVVSLADVDRDPASRVARINLFRATDGTPVLVLLRIGHEGER